MKLALPLLSIATLLVGCATASSPPTPATIAPVAAPRPARVTEHVPAPKVRLASEVQVARYTTLPSLPSEADAEPLAVVVKVHFPRATVSTVGDAVRHLLLRTGYRLADADRLDERVRSLMALGLPDNQRTLGPYRVDAMLGALAGRSFRLVSDPASRVITYAAASANSLAANGAPVTPPVAGPSDTKPVVDAAPVSLQQRGSQ